VVLKRGLGQGQCDRYIIFAWWSLDYIDIRQDKFIPADEITYIGSEAASQEVKMTEREYNQVKKRMEYKLRTKDGEPFLNGKWIPEKELEHKKPEAKPASSPPPAPSQEKKAPTLLERVAGCFK
jgi:hypothetical protein